MTPLRRLATAALVALLLTSLARPHAHAVTIDWVTVGDPGNAADSTGYGAVDYEYKISKYEVTIGQYCDFLNATAKSDPYGLYNPDMGTNLWVAGISRSGTSGDYEYTVMAAAGSAPFGGVSGANRPITYVSWFDAARFANWMHNGQGAGSTETGAYELNGQAFFSAPAVNPGARFSIPTVNEWYKAAYYKGGGSNAGYWTYSPQSDLVPGNTIGGSGNQANYRAYSIFWSGNPFAVTGTPFILSSQNYLTDVGAFSGSQSAYGTLDQTGNASEWNDLTGSSGFRGKRGGSWQDGYPINMSSSNRAQVSPLDEDSYSGFRLASPVVVPEPSTWVMGLTGIACGGFSMWRRRKRHHLDRSFISALSLALVAAFLFSGPAHAVTIDMVTVGDAGNAADQMQSYTYGSFAWGAVPYEYRIGKYEITIVQYAEFLNAVAKSDPYGLYNTKMGTNLNVAGISRSNSEGSYEYTVMNNGGSSGNRPITYISWFDAARFANWMHNGQGSGSTETGAYTLNGATSGNAPARNEGASFYIPTDSEWYKAAYYKGGSTNAGYWKYATQSDSDPGNLIGDAANQANYYRGSGGTGQWSVTQDTIYYPYQNYLTEIGAFTASTSAYGTFDQSGNAYEWTDSTVDFQYNRGQRGGSWFNGVMELSSTQRWSLAAEIEDLGGQAGGMGFRLAAPVAVPEPSTYAMALAGMASGGFSMWRRRKRA